MIAKDSVLRLLILWRERLSILIVLKMNDMERKIGEIFEYNGEWYQCVESPECALCAFNETDCNDIDIGDCARYRRSDGKSVIFKKLEKVGEPFVIEKVLYQHYKVFDIDNVYGDGFFWCVHNYKARTLTIGLKQNKEDMEENHKAEDTLLTRLVGRYVNNLIDYETFEKMVKQLYSDKKDSKPTLKEFDLEAAKAGKPVCTRDGRKARIICFDNKDNQFPIVALVDYYNRKDGEAVTTYTNEGFFCIDKKHPEDLMMLPEKKEGWVNISRSIDECFVPFGKIYPTRGTALADVPNDEEYVTTIPIYWEE